MNIGLFRNSALVHTRKNCASPRKKGFPLLMRKFMSSFGGFSVKAFTNRDFLLDRMLNNIDGLCAERDRLKKEQPRPSKGNMLGGRRL
jgi:hypothetical protein